MKTGRSVRSVVILTAVLTGVWYLLSGKFDLLHFGSGVVTAAIIALNVHPVADTTRVHVGRFVLFIPWLIGQIVISNLRVARIVLARRVDIAPVFVAQVPGVTGARALTTLGCSTTLTPGTLTIEVGDKDLFVHALDQASAQDVRDQVMAKRIVRIFSPRSGE